MKKKFFLTLIGDVHGHSGPYTNYLKKCENSIQLGDLDFNYKYLSKIDPIHHKVLAGNHDNYSLKPRFDLTPDDPYVNKGNGKFIVKFDDVFEFQEMGDHFLGHYGNYTPPGVENPVLNPKMFFVRGAFSIDKKFRTPCLDWFEDEELTYKLMCDAITFYKNAKPDIVISHDCPGVIYPMLGIFDSHLSATANMLTQMFEYHQPKYWIFGHHHQDIYKKVYYEDKTVVYDVGLKLNYWDEYSFKEYTEPLKTEGTRFICLNELSLLRMNNKLEIVGMTKQ